MKAVNMLNVFVRESGHMTAEVITSDMSYDSYMSTCKTRVRAISLALTAAHLIISSDRESGERSVNRLTSRSFDIMIASELNILCAAVVTVTMQRWMWLIGFTCISPASQERGHIIYQQAS